MKKTKNNNVNHQSPGSLLAHVRWDKTPTEERMRVNKMLNEARKKAQVLRKQR